jgi:hypothetical protein
MKHKLAAPLFALVCTFAVPSAIAQDESVLSDIHKRLLIPKYEARHDHNRILFVGEITALGGVDRYAVCKAAVRLETVDYAIADTLDTLLGDPPEQLVHTGYVNCTGEALPSPPYTLHAKVIVYCFHNMSGKNFKCLAPVAFTEDRLKKVKFWIAESIAADRHSPS